MAAPAYPSRRFARAPLDLAAIGPPERFGRIYLDKYPDPLGFGKTPSRFSDPRALPEAGRFGVLYLGRTLKVCFLEAVLRDRRNGAVSDYPIEEAELRQRIFAEVAFKIPLRLVDLRGDGSVRMGVPTDAIRASDQRAGRLWSAALHEHPDQPDGIVYDSRLNGETNMAIYDRALGKLRVEHTQPLIRAPGFADLLNSLRVAIV